MTDKIDGQRNIFRRTLESNYVYDQNQNYNKIFNIFSNYDKTGRTNVMDESELKIFNNLIQIEDTKLFYEEIEKSNINFSTSEIQLIKKAHNYRKNILNKFWGIAKGFPYSDYKKLMDKKFPDTFENEEKRENLINLYKFFSETRTNDIMNKATIDRREYINLGLLYQKHVMSEESDENTVLRNMLNDIKSIPNGNKQQYEADVNLQNCTIEDLKEFLLIEQEYFESHLHTDRFVVQESYGETMDHRSLIEDYYLDKTEFGRATRLTNERKMKQSWRGECSFDAFMTTYGNNSIEIVRDGTYIVKFEGIYNTKTQKPLEVVVTTEELNDRALRGYNGTFDMLAYGCAYDKLRETGMLENFHWNESRLENHLSTHIEKMHKRVNEDIDNNISNVIKSNLTKLETLDDPEELKRTFSEFSKTIDEKLKDEYITKYCPNTKSYLLELKKTVDEINDKLNYVCTDTNPLEKALAENSPSATKTLREITEEIESIYDEMDNFKLMGGAVVYKKNLTDFEQKYDIANCPSGEKQGYILKKYNQAKKLMNDLESCKDLKTTIQKVKEDNSTAIEILTNECNILMRNYQDEKNTTNKNKLLAVKKQLEMNKGNVEINSLLANINSCLDPNGLFILEDDAEIQESKIISIDTSDFLESQIFNATPYMTQKQAILDDDYRKDLKNLADKISTIDKNRQQDANVELNQYIKNDKHTRFISKIADYNTKYLRAESSYAQYHVTAIAGKRTKILREIDETVDLSKGAVIELIGAPLTEFGTNFKTKENHYTQPYPLEKDPTKVTGHAIAVVDYLKDKKGNNIGVIVQDSNYPDKLVKMDYNYLNKLLQGHYGCKIKVILEEDDKFNPETFSANF